MKYEVKYTSDYYLLV